jgi:tetratricopeptide (TPR) repeat protein
MGRLRRSWFAAAAFALAAATLASAADLTRPQALAQLQEGAPPARRDAIARLGEIGTMPDVQPLIQALRDPDEEVRARAERAIWQIWSRSGKPEVDALYRIGMDAVERGELDKAIETFTQVIKLDPSFAEAWNKRATLYFLAGDLRRSLADCDEVIKRNPQHFGALAGYAQIHLQLENYERALAFARRAVAVNPNLEGTRQLIEALEQLVEQRKGRQV